MSGKDMADPEFAADDVNHGYFFGGEYKESSILSEFGWNIPAESLRDCDGGFADFQPDMAASRSDSHVSTEAYPPRGVSRSSTEQIVEKMEASASASPSHPSISSSSSEDPPTAPGVSSAAAANQPSDTANKPKRKGQKRIRQARYAFVTKTEVDHLEDGYRWRKYGQKAVKNSPFPSFAPTNPIQVGAPSIDGSYYRCTNSKCIVKKRIERSSEDPSVVITTYEGQHCHLSTGYPRVAGGGLIAQEAAFPRYLTPSNSSQLYHPRFQHTPQESSPTIRPPQDGGGGETRAAVEPEAGEGLLGDIVPPRMRNG